MTDWRKTENRARYFDHLYRINLQHRMMPGMVYRYLEGLAEALSLTEEQRYWMVFLNGLTQNPITTKILLERQPEPGCSQATEDWFNEHWSKLQFDTDRRYQKKDTPSAMRRYREIVGSRPRAFLDRSARETWQLIEQEFLSFGRLATFSYMEYLWILRLGPEIESLMFRHPGSKSHRNGMLFLIGREDLAQDRRNPTAIAPKGQDLDRKCHELELTASQHLARLRVEQPHRDIGPFTYESNLCTFKNHFFGRRYPGVYADMAYERIEKAEAAGWNCDLFRGMREELPDWLRVEKEPKPWTLNRKAALFRDTGTPYRAEHFLTES